MGQDAQMNRNPRQDAGAYSAASCGGGHNHCDPAGMPRAPLNSKGCPVGNVQCQQELGLDTADVVVAGAANSSNWVPYREFTPLSLWNTSAVVATGVITAGVIITAVRVGSRDQIKGELAADLYLPTTDRGHDVHWDAFDPNTPLRLTYRNDAAVDLGINFVVKGAAFRS